MITTQLRHRALTVTGVLAVASGLATAGLALAPAVAAGPAVASSPAGAATGGVLDWGVKESFRSYVEGPVADGEITMLAPATRNANGTFTFPGGTGELDPAAGTASVALQGGVLFEGHVGALELEITDLRIEIAGGAGVVVADMRSSSADFPDVDLVSFDLAGESLQPDANGVVTLTDVATTLTTEGAPAFGEFYEPGAAMDPLTFSVTVEGSDPTETPTTTPPTTVPPTTVPPTTVPPTSTSTTPTGTQTPPEPTQPDPTATWEEGEVSSGLMEWGIKESFRSYIAGPIADGGWTTTGVGESGGIFRWTSSFGDFDLGEASGSVGFSGGVRFTGHEESLDITISRPRVRFDGAGGAVLVVDVRSKGLEDGGFVEQTSVDFATLDLAAASSSASDDDSVSYAGIPAVLTAAGAAGFGGFYEAGAELDPVTVAFAVGGATVPGGGSAGGPGGGLAGTGAGGSLGLAGVAAVLLVLGGGLVLAGRRLRPTAA